MNYCRGVLLIGNFQAETELENISGGSDPFREFLEGRSPGRNDRALSRREKVYITEDGEVGGKIETFYGDEDYPYVKVK